MILEVFFNLNSIWFCNSVTWALFFALSSFELRHFSMAKDVWLNSCSIFRDVGVSESWTARKWMGLDQQWRSFSALEEQERERLNHCSAFVLHGQTSMLKPREWGHQRARIQKKVSQELGREGIVVMMCEDDVREEASVTTIFNLWVTRVKGGYDLREET